MLTHTQSIPVAVAVVVVAALCPPGASTG